MVSKHALREQEAWLRREGLGLIIPGRRRFPRLLPAIAPFMVFALLANFGISQALNATDHLEETALEELTLTSGQLTWLTVGLLCLLLSVPAAVVYQLWQRRRRVALQRTAALVLLAGWLVSCPLLETPLLEVVAAILLPGIVIYLEIPSMLRWAGACVKKFVTLLSPMVLQVLPFLLLAQLLVFFTGEMWQMAYSFDKARMWAVCGLLFVPTVLLTWSQSTRALRANLDQDLDGQALLADTPFERIGDRAELRLRRSERINLALLPTIAQLIQVLLFVAVVFVFFVAFGSVALSPKLISTWTGQPPIRMIWLGIAMPIDLTLFRVSMMLAVFSGLSFAASNATDESYRAVFLAPIVNDMERGLAARRRYGA